MIKRRSWLGRLWKFPEVFKSHYEILRRYNGWMDSLMAAWSLAMELLR